MNLPLRKGTGGPNKTEEESKQFMLQIFDLENFKEKLQHNFPKMRGGGRPKAVWNFAEIYPFWCGHPSQILWRMHDRSLV